VLRRNKILVRRTVGLATDEILSMELHLLQWQIKSFKLGRNTTPETHLSSC